MTSFPAVRFGPIVYERPASYRSPTLHFLVVGCTGSGKTTLFKQLTSSALCASAWRPGSRALVYDGKQDIIPFLYGLGLAARLQIVNPLDSRCLAWKMSQDVVNPINARQVATLLVPRVGDPSGSSEFFDQACREILTSVMLALIGAASEGETWTFRDVIAGTLNTDLRRRLLASSNAADGASHHTLSDTYQNYIDVHRELRNNIQASLRAKLSIFEPIAALWHRAESNGFFSIEEWANGEGKVLVLGNDESARASIDALNKVLFKRATECLLSKPEVAESALKRGEARSWILFDEVREAGQLDGLRRLMNKGRSKGACVCLTMQDVEGLRAEYGKEEANEILGQCATIAVLRLSNPETAEWASDLFGQSVQTVDSDSLSFGEKTQIGSSTSTDIRPRVPTSLFLDLQPASQESGVSGFFTAPGMTAKLGQKAFLPQTISWDAVRSNIPIDSALEAHAASVPAPGDLQYLQVHDRDELALRFSKLDLTSLAGDKSDLAVDEIDQLMNEHGL